LRVRHGEAFGDQPATLSRVATNTRCERLTSSFVPQHAVLGGCA
jgi:hypothetical protein